MGHAPIKFLRPRRIVASLVLGVVVTIALCMLLAAFFLPSDWVTKSTLDKSTLPPTFVAQIAPELMDVTLVVPAHRSSGEPLLGGLNLGIDLIVYSYGGTPWDTNFQPWDPATSPEPTYVDLTRFRFGWPMRTLSMDEVSTGASTAIPQVRAYHQRAYALAAADRGLNRPAWIPRFIPLHRIPIAVNWTALGINTLVWGAVCYLLLSCRPLIKSHTRRNRARRGLCPSCRYDLQGLPTCPECGPVSSTPDG